MIDPVIGPSDRERRQLAVMLGYRADKEFERQCLRVGLDPAEAMRGSPLFSLATQRARFLLQEGRA